MPFQFTHPQYLLLLPVAWAWVTWLVWKSDVQISRWRRWLALGIRLLVVRLGTAAFPETGQKRLVLLSDGNENIGDAEAALLAARPLGVTFDVVPLGVERGNDVSVQKLGLPNRVKKGQTFEAKIFIQADKAQPATLRLYRNDQPLGDQKVELTAGKNLFTFPQTLDDPGFYSYT